MEKDENEILVEPFRKDEVKYEIISNAGKIGLLLPDLYINYKKVLPIYDRLTNTILFNIQEWRELKKEEIKNAVA